jgi:hypothetical protein
MKLDDETNEDEATHIEELRRRESGQRIGAPNAIWLQRTYYQETVRVFIHAWDLYVKFWTVFITFNVVSLGFASRIPVGGRSVVVAAFVVQNLLTLGTSFWIARYSKDTDKKLSSLASHLAGANTDVAEVAKGSPVPTRLAAWGGYANCIASICLIVCWVVVLRVPMDLSSLLGK